MALKAAHASDVRSLDRVPENASISLCCPTRLPTCVEYNSKAASFQIPKFVVVGHRGHGMNVVQSPDPRMRAFKENSIVSFNAAAEFPIDFVEFDVQVTRDGCPVIFHDNFIYSEENGEVEEKRVTELSVEEFGAYGKKRLIRKTKEGKMEKWKVEWDAPLCTLQEAFQEVNPKLGFNIELKFDDNLFYSSHLLSSLLQPVLQVVSEHAKDRPIIFSSFQPDAAIMARKLQSSYPVYLLTNGGTEIYKDPRRNSVEEAIRVCGEGGLQGIVSEVKGVLRKPGVIPLIKQAKLGLMTYGKLNNVAEAVYMQLLMGVEGVIVDHVKEMSEAVSDMLKPLSPSPPQRQQLDDDDDDDGSMSLPRPRFSQHHLSFLLKLIPQLIQP